MGLNNPMNNNRFQTFSFETSGSVAAGATRTDVDITGKGKVLVIGLDVGGSATDASKSKIQITIDGEATDSVDLSIRHIRRMNNGTLSPARYGGVSTFDDSNFDYICHLNPETDFDTSLKIKFENGDGSNASNIRTVILYQLEVT